MATNFAAPTYTPGNPPADASQLQRYLNDELSKISAAIGALNAGYIAKTYAAPTKPRDGMLRRADGTSWNPGSGAGVYYYDDVSTSWKFLG